MCLDTIDEKKKDWRFGYKIFWPEGKYLTSIYYSRGHDLKDSIGTRHYPKNKWIEDKNKYSITSFLYDEYYETGFHFYREYPKDMRSPGETIKKVRVRKVVATGTQSGAFVGVAKEIYIED